MKNLHLSTGDCAIPTYSQQPPITAALATTAEEFILAKPPLKHTHSLEIPEFGNETQATGKGEKTFVGIADTASQALFGFSGLDEDLCWQYLSPLNGNSVGELDLLFDKLPQQSALNELPAFSSLSNNDLDVRKPASPYPRQKKRKFSRKEQIQSLRETVAELSQLIRDLQMSNSSVTISPPSPAFFETSEDVTSILSQHKSLWEHVAARRLILLQAAQKENARLRGQVALHKRHVRNIKRVVRRRNDNEVTLLNWARVRVV
ncbi:unnamed protein product [Phytophthora fragariaefolia]|uniref:Unnamed protein product n=1 Tax=Phytophthora fragariaefolia TaxID=1490495 RepID=A0A9W6XNX4_9STRA|nr:unnamed protein product [Phytophthora fragariaefolia]